MCGLAGVISRTLNGIETDLFRELMVVSTFRGPTGAGVIGVDDKLKQANIVKTKMTGAHLMFGEHFSKMMDVSRSALIGHCRYPTKGDANEYGNIHPHRAEHIVGVHNGTIDRIDGVHIKDSESDSNLLFQKIAQLGIEKAVETVKGAYACVWWDNKTKTVNFLRNEDRPLWFGWIGEHDNPGTVYWASEWGMLNFILGRSTTGKISIRPLTPNVLLTYNTKDMTATRKELEKPYVAPIVHRNPPFQIGNRPSAGQDWRRRVQDERAKSAARLATNAAERFHIGGKPREPLNSSADSKETLINHYITRETLNKALMDGCADCSIPAVPSEYEKGLTRWITRTTFLCDNCAKKPDNKNYFLE